MTTTLCKWLDECEDRLWRMTRGVFHFLLHWLPEWIIRVLLETVGPAVVRAVRVFFALCVWLTLLFGPGEVAIALGGPFWVDVGAVLWSATAAAGSVYGLYRVVKKRRANAAASAMDAAPPPVAHLLPG